MDIFYSCFFTLLALHNNPMKYSIFSAGFLLFAQLATASLERVLQRYARAPAGGGG